MQADLYDVAEKIVAARELDVTAAQIAAAKRNKKTLIAPLEPTVQVEITYDTIGVEGGRLIIYPDIYERKLNTVDNVRKELQTSGVDDDRLTNAAIKRMIASATGKQKFVVATTAIESGLGITKGRAVSVVNTPAARIPPRAR
jgi:hypothetical protein